MSTADSTDKHANPALARALAANNAPVSVESALRFETSRRCNNMTKGTGGVRCVECGASASASGTGGPIVLAHKPFCSGGRVAAVRDEMTCDRCGRYHGVVWFAPSDVWNQTMRGGDRGNPDRYAFCCPICFMLLAEEAGIETTGWLVTPFDDGPVRATNRSEHD